MSALRSLLADDSGAALVEYALASALLGALMIVALAAVAAACASRLTTTSGALTALGATPP